MSSFCGWSQEQEKPMSRVIAAVLIAVVLQLGPLKAQEQSNASRPPDVVQKIIEPKYLSGNRADRAIALVNSLRPHGDVDVVWDRLLNTLVLKGTAEQVAEMEA